MFGLKLIDRYIIKKFLGTFIFAILIIISIAVIFDISEKIDDFLERGATMKQIVFDYYLNFIPYFAVLFSSLFTFISVIFFTSKMAYNTEIIAILNSGMSFYRMLVPYFVSALILATFSFMMSNYVLPYANAKRLDFEEHYLHEKPVSFDDQNIHKQVKPGVFIYMESYSNITNVGYKFSIEKYNKDGQMISKLMSDYITWDSLKSKWSIKNYYIRNINGLKEQIINGSSIDTTLSITPSDFRRRDNYVETMSLSQLNKYIAEQKMQGAENIDALIIEKDKRLAFPLSTFILTLIGVSLSSRKVRGGIGMQIGLGILLSFAYILFLQFSSQFAISGTFSPLLAAWIPNIIFSIIALFLLKVAPK
ncbi:MAG: LptF/LptG family permease [Bacteroidota bacterium]|nr:LptF/LptG family permease [Bacteroidota bacterium]MDP4273263.1 LptF/LptG family permease [Bacteroidota bacterium]